MKEEIDMGLGVTTHEEDMMNGEELDMIKTWNMCITRHGVDNMKEEHDLGKAWDDRRTGHDKDME